jgi:mannose-1-phosphate guanylyltransferase
VQAVVLVGGFGTRLRPLTWSTPKQMLHVGNRPMVERVLEHLHAHGVERAVLSLGYRPDAFRDAYPDGRCGGVALHYSVEPAPLDTAGAIRFAARDAGIRERMVVVNGDVLTDLDVSGLVARHDAAGAEGTIALHRVEDPSSFGVVPTGPDGRVVAFIEKPRRAEAPTDRINAGTYVLEPEVLDRIAADVPVNVERVTFPAMVADGSLYAFDGDAYWIDAGTPATYLQANLDLLDGRRGEPEEAIDGSAVVDGSAIRSWVGPRCRIAAGARVEGSVLLAGATVAAGAVVEASIVGPGATVGEAARVTGGAVIGDGVALRPGTSTDGLPVPDPASGPPPGST